MSYLNTMRIFEDSPFFEEAISASKIEDKEKIVIANFSQVIQSINKYLIEPENCDYTKFLMEPPENLPKNYLIKLKLLHVVMKLSECEFLKTANILDELFAEEIYSGVGNLNLSNIILFRTS